MEEKKVEVTNSNGDWSDEYKSDRPKSDSSWFSDIVPENEIAYITEIKFKTEGEKTVNKFGKEVIKFLIEHEGKEKTMEVGTNQYDYLKILATNKPLIGKKFKHQRTGTTQKDTRRTIKVI